MSINITNGLWGSQKPIVVFFGETGCGKTTALVRLITYLHENQGCRYELCKTFHRHYYPSEPIETVHAEFDKQFEVEIQKVEGTALSCFCNVLDKDDDIICRFLDTPGENLFSVSRDSHKAESLKGGADIPIFQYQYLNDILDTEDYQKIWVFFMDIDMLSTHKAYADEYLENITRIAKRVAGKEKDKMIFVINKEDRVRELFGPVLKQGCEAYINNLFNDILAKEPFTTKTYFLGRAKEKKHFRAIPYCSYTVVIKGKDMEGKQLPPDYLIGSEVYPDDMWHTIQDAISYKF